MTNNNGGRICPKCGMNLGQKHLCPVCDKRETESEQDSPNTVSLQAQNEESGGAECARNAG